MYAYPLDELAWAVGRERQEEARRARPHTEDPPASPESLRALLAHVIGCLDPAAPGSSGCH